MKSGPLTCIVGLSLLIPASAGLLFDGAPMVLSPLPALTVLPAFLLSLVSPQLFKAAVFVPVIFFFAWNPRAFRGDPKIPKRSYVLLALATVLSLVWFVFSWNYGLEYQGALHTYVVCIVNIAWVGFLWVMFTRTWKVGSSFKTNLFLHWMLFAWLAWYAFPYLGELP
jgi:hypothetical protein